MQLLMLLQSYSYSMMFFILSLSSGGSRRAVCLKFVLLDPAQGSGTDMNSTRRQNAVCDLDCSSTTDVHRLLWFFGIAILTFSLFVVKNEITIRITEA